MQKSIQKIALIVTLGTFLSKLAGMIRQLVIAGAFGIGAAYDAYNYAYIIPGFFLVLLGGINGPFHNGMITVLSRKSKKEGDYLIGAITTIISLILIITTLIIIITANQLISILAPGLNNDIHIIAVMQLRIMAPIALLSGVIGIGFGSLNARNEFFITSISPLISSITITIFVIIFWLDTNQSIQTNDLVTEGGIVLALSTLIGACLQCLVQLNSLIRKKLSKFRLIWDLKNSGVREIFKIIIPATFSSGMLQINVFTDLFFASGIIGAASGLSYANFIVQAPLGLISNAIIIPLLPSYSNLINIDKKPELIKKIRQGLITSIASMIALASILIPLSSQITQLIYERGAFNSNAVFLVSNLLIAYSIGMPAYLSRDLLVRVFYAVGDGKTPFRISTSCVILNIFFDWFLIGGPTPSGNTLPFNFGAPGIVYATVIINFVSCIALLIKLQSKLVSIPFIEWSLDSLKLLLSGTLSAVFIWGLTSLINWPENFINIFIEVTFTSIIGLSLFILLSNFLKINEVNKIIKILKAKIIRF